MGNHTATKPVLRRADDDPLLVVFGDPLSPHQQKNPAKNNVVRVGPPLTNFLDPRMIDYLWVAERLCSKPPHTPHYVFDRSACSKSL